MGEKLHRYPALPVQALRASCARVHEAAMRQESLPVPGPTPVIAGGEPDFFVPDQRRASWGRDDDLDDQTFDVNYAFETSLFGAPQRPAADETLAASYLVNVAVSLNADLPRVTDAERLPNGPLLIAYAGRMVAFSQALAVLEAFNNPQRTPGLSQLHAELAEVIRACDEGLEPFRADLIAALDGALCPSLVVGPLEPEMRPLESVGLEPAQAEARWKGIGDELAAYRGLFAFLVEGLRDEKDFLEACTFLPPESAFDPQVAVEELDLALTALASAPAARPERLAAALEVFEQLRGVFRDPVIGQRFALYANAFEVATLAPATGAASRAA